MDASARRAIRAGALAAIVALVALSQMAAASASSVRGQVRNTTCYGPCMIDGPPPPLYGGDDAEVTIVARDHRDIVVASKYAHDGRFHFRLEPGRYLAWVRIRGEGADQWSSDAERFRARPKKTARVTLEVANQAIVK